MIRCDECGMCCEVITVDFGIGLYEYFGTCGDHQDGELRCWF